MKRTPELDGLRGIAILAVMSFHLGQWIHPSNQILRNLLQAGWCGVDLFFVLSGFLIGGGLLDSLHDPNYYRAFYVRRAFRILPMYLAVSVIFGVIHDVRSPNMPWWTFATFTQAFFIASAGWGQNLELLWSLSIEEWFYAVAPVTIKRIRERLPIVVMSAVIICLTIRWLAIKHLSHAAATTLFFGRADDLLLGVGVAMLLRDRPEIITVNASRARAGVIGLLAVFLMAVMRGFVHREQVIVATLGFTFIGIGFAAVIALIVTGELPALSRVLRLGVLQHFGREAYGLYLLQLPMATVAAIFHVTLMVELGLSTALTICAAHLCWIYIESPAIKQGKEFCGHRTIAVAATNP